MYFYYQKDTFGKWTARTSADKPLRKSINGPREIRNEVLLKKEDQGLSINMLERLFPLTD